MAVLKKEQYVTHI